jgi:hypothetical protein
MIYILLPRGSIKLSTVPHGSMSLSKLRILSPLVLLSDIVSGVAHSPWHAESSLSALARSSQTSGPFAALPSMADSKLTVSSSASPLQSYRALGDRSMKAEESTERTTIGFIQAGGGIQIHRRHHPSRLGYWCGRKGEKNKQPARK